MQDAGISEEDFCELERRIKRHEDHPEEAVSWDQVKARISSELQSHRRKMLERRPRTRAAFAKFLDELAVGQSSVDDWQYFIVAHFADEIIENIRRHVARLSIQRSIGGDWTDDDRQLLRSWSRLLHG